MPLTRKGTKVKAAMIQSYGRKKGTEVFYATENKGDMPGLVKMKRKRKKTKKRRY